MSKSKDVQVELYIKPDEFVGDLISRQVAIDIVRFECGEWEGLAKTIIKRFKQLPERKMRNKEWIDFLAYQFDVSRTSAKEMLHCLMCCKREDNFKKQFNGRR